MSGRLDNSELVTLLDSKVSALDTGSKSRDQVVREILRLLADEPYAVERDYINVDGRVSFGRSHAQEDGIAVFVPDDVDDHGNGGDDA